MTYLVANSGFSKALDESYHHFRVLPLVGESSDSAFCQQFLGKFFDLFERATQPSSGVVIAVIN